MFCRSLWMPFLFHAVLVMFHAVCQNLFFDLPMYFPLYVQSNCGKSQGYCLVIALVYLYWNLFASFLVMLRLFLTFLNSCQIFKPLFGTTLIYYFQSRYFCYFSFSCFDVRLRGLLKNDVFLFCKLILCNFVVQHWFSWNDLISKNSKF